MAVLGEVCSHAAALLFYLESSARVTLSCTQIGCQWNEPTIIDTIPYPHLYKFSTRATAWGCDHEAEATTAYVKSMNDHQNFTYKQSGLVVSASHPYIGASSDGIINCDCCG